MADIANVPILLATLLFGYILGATPFGVIVTRLSGTGDVRAQGSGNIGATNVLRLGNKWLAAATLLGDILKGTLAVVLIAQWGHEPMMAAAFGALLGHIFPIWLKFRGGKGVATYLGTLLGLAWPAGLAFCAIWMLTAIISRISSLSALAAALLVPLGLLWFGHNQLGMFFAAMSAILYATHRENIARLINKTEAKIGADNG